ncbi:MAG: carbamoyltransferase C-terminal domain-containing protein [Gemmatimonadota bacterium]|nr:carbamoyltransferase C-terminal domain-containing protein [Gemmatimonadota bacterium]
MNRLVLGLYDGPSGAAALFREGHPPAVFEEDRLRRIHGVTGLPRASIQSVLAASGVSGGDMDAVLIAPRSGTHFAADGSDGSVQAAWSALERAAPGRFSRPIRDAVSRARRRRLDEALRSEFGFGCPIRFVERLHALAAGAIHSAGVPDALVLLLDRGWPGRWWSAVASVEAGRVEVLSRQGGTHSLYTLLESACTRLGLLPNADRCRVLEEMASAGSPVYKDSLSTLFCLEDDRYHAHRALFRFGGPLAGVPRRTSPEDVAASVLAAAGETLAAHASRWLARTGHRHVVLGGVLFELPSLVRHVVETARGATVHLPVALGGGGIALGTAFTACLPGTLPQPFRPPPPGIANACTGPFFDDSLIAEELRREPAVFERPDDMEQQIAKLLAHGKTVSRFLGPSEVGAESLGNRAILREARSATRRNPDPLPPGSFHALVPEGDLDALFHSPDGLDRNDLTHHPLPLRARRGFRELCPNLVAPDGAVRTQIASGRSNAALMRILAEYEHRTGVPCLAVAPLRLPGEPLAATPGDAYRFSRRLGVDRAAMGSYLVEIPGATHGEQGVLRVLPPRDTSAGGC